MRVAILGIEPIHPPTGGSRLRLQGLYGALGAGIEATYVGAFHWWGPELRRLRHGSGLEEVTVPFSERHLAAVQAMAAAIPGAGLVDATFPRLGHLSEDYCFHARAAAWEADIVIFSHPWAYAVAGDLLQPGRQVVVYDAHNVEADLRRCLLDGSQAGRSIAAEVAALERRLCEAADLVLACSHEDRLRFADLYGIPAARIQVAPNGVAAGAIRPPGLLARTAARARLRLGRRPVALFIGGDYPPNVEAARFIAERLAPSCPAVDFVILGAAGNALTGALPPNLGIAGTVTERVKRLWLRAADAGVNPMGSGSGTNIKMFDYMAAGLPVVATPFGARGIAESDALVLAEPDGFAEALTRLLADPKARRAKGRQGRAVVERSFDWATISPELGALLQSRRRAKGERAPFFTVTVPTLDRPDRLRRLLDLLAAQRERDFEVVVVDQSAAPFAPGDFGIDLTLLHSKVRGQARARNFAAAVGRGQVIAFIDDDCEPPDGWLAAARPWFDRPDVVALEGRCMSDRRQDEGWRAVHNYGAEGDGFMSCNLFARAEAFHRLGGFDLAYDAIGFRYDTDLGWRLQELGAVPFSEDAFVYHPPWTRNIARESRGARDRMFAADALLLRRHPERYRALFLREGHWRRGEAFWRPFLAGLAAEGLPPPDYVRERLPAGRP